MRKRIIISVTSDLCTDQRVGRVANACFNNGYDVLLIGRKLKTSDDVSFDFKSKRLKLLFNHSAFFYAEYNIRLFLFLLFSKADIFLSNDTDTLVANFMAANIRRKKLLFDAHELFPEVPELINRPAIKGFWKMIENIIFPHLKHCYTVCESIAQYYSKKYNIDMKVVRNVPNYRFETRQHPIDSTAEKIILYQGAINKGRGLEWVLEAMPYVNNAKLVIIGDGDMLTKLKQQSNQLGLGNKVEFLGKFSVQKLHEYTPKASLGLGLAENLGLSYYYSLPNRVFDFIQAGVPILSTRFPEIANVVERYKTGMLIDHYEPEFLAGVINQLLENQYPTAHFETVAKELCWENEEKVLLEILASLN